MFKYHFNLLYYIIVIIDFFLILINIKKIVFSIINN